jgi:hypothetical protein
MLTSTEPALIAIVTVNEGNVVLLSGTLLDEESAPVPVAALGTMTLTLYDLATDAIINSRDGQNILNLNGGTFAPTSGAFELTLGSADNPIVTPAAIPVGQTETHIALLESTWSGGGWCGIARILVRQVHRRPATP